MELEVLVIVGPTASGKSGLAVRLAKKLNGEIISADSRQVYRGLNIGTGKITRKEMGGIRHHLLDVAHPRRQFTVQRFKKLADKAIADIAGRGKLPILCGGTGFYIDTVINDAELPAVKADIRLRARLAKITPGRLLAMLKKLDPARWRAISANPSDKKNARRLIRAIEVAKTTGNKRAVVSERTMSASRTVASATIVRYMSSTHHSRKYAPIFIGIQPPLHELKARIRARLEKRLRSGMIAEARKLHEPGGAGNPGGGISWKRMEELGLEYRYLSRYLRGLITRHELEEQLLAAIWRYARKQMTWWRRNGKIRWMKNGGNTEVAAGRFWKSAYH